MCIYAVCFFRTGLKTTSSSHHTRPFRRKVMKKHRQCSLSLAAHAETHRRTLSLGLPLILAHFHFFPSKFFTVNFQQDFSLFKLLNLFILLWKFISWTSQQKIRTEMKIQFLLKTWLYTAGIPGWLLVGSQGHRNRITTARQVSASNCCKNRRRLPRTKAGAEPLVKVIYWLVFFMSA